jgi:D-lactate dehydrogenase (cytochrome)
MLANNAAGIRTVKYGACKDNVLRLQVALPDGRLIHVGSRSVKQSAGYDLLHLFVGSEGTLGVITEATLQLAPIPPFISAVVASFPTVERAVEAVVAVRGSGLEPAALEFVDAAHTRMLSQEEGVSLAERPTLFMEFHAAHEDALQAGLKLVRQLCREMGALDVQATADPTARRRLWHARHHAYEIARRHHPGTSFVIVDVAVPISHFPLLIAHVQETLTAHDLTGYLIGHAGDGNVHVLLPFDDDASRRKANAVNAAIVTRALELEGTSTGEHGVGIGKAHYMEEEHGPAVALMRDIKEMVDRKGIMNPGKIFR